MATVATLGADCMYTNKHQKLALCVTAVEPTMIAHDHGVEPTMIAHDHGVEPTMIAHDHGVEPTRKRPRAMSDTAFARIHKLFSPRFLELQQAYVRNIFGIIEILEKTPAYRRT